MKFLKTLYQKSRWSFFWKNYQLPSLDILALVDTENREIPAVTEEMCLPPYAGDNGHDDVDPLLRLIKYYKPRVVLELGTAHGTTVANICMVSDAKVYTVNALPEQMSGKITTFTLDKDEIGYVYRKYGFADRVEQIFENTETMALEKYLPFHTVEFAIIDACHDPDFVLNDFLKVLPFLTDDAIVLFHDVNPSMRLHLADSYVACMYLRRLTFNIYHIQNTWWAVWQRGTGEFHLSAMQRLVVATENLLLKILGFDLQRDVVHIRRLATMFVASKIGMAA